MIIIFIVAIASFVLGYAYSATTSTSTVTKLLDELEQRDLDNSEVHECLGKSFDRLGGLIPVFEYLLDSDDLAKLRAKYPPGLRIAVTTTATHHKSFLGTVAWVNDGGAIVVEWDDEDAPKLVVDKKIIKSIPGRV